MYGNPALKMHVQLPVSSPTSKVLGRHHTIPTARKKLNKLKISEFPLPIREFRLQGKLAH